MQHLLTYTFLLHYPRLDYSVWFTVRDGSIGLCLLIPLTYLRDLFVLIWIHVLTSVICLLLLLIIIIIYHLCTGYLQIHAWKNHAPRVYSIAAILQLHFMEHVLLFPMYILYFYISTFLHMCAVPSMAVFCSSFILWLLVCCSDIFCMILRWFQLPLLLLGLPILHSRCATVTIVVIIIIIIVIIINAYIYLPTSLDKCTHI